MAYAPYATAHPVHQNGAAMDIRNPADFLEWLADEGAFTPRDNEETPFSLSVEPIIRGLVTLGHAGTGVLQEITSCKPVPQVYGPLDGTFYRRKFIAYNRMAAGSYVGSDVFGVLGELNLLAVIVETGVGWRGRQATSVTLVLSTRVEETRHDTVTTVRWDTSGGVVAESFAPYTEFEGDSKESQPVHVERREFLEHLLGITPLVREPRLRQVAGSPSLVLSENAAETLRDNLPDLGPYLTELAERLGN